MARQRSVSLMIFDHFHRPLKQAEAIAKHTSSLKHWKAYIVLYANFCSRKTMLFTQTSSLLDEMMVLFIP